MACQTITQRFSEFKLQMERQIQSAETMWVYNGLLKKRLPYFTKNNPYIIAIVTNSTSNSQIEPVLWCQDRHISRSLRSAWLYSEAMFQNRNEMKKKWKKKQTQEVFGSRWNVWDGNFSRKLPWYKWGILPGREKGPWEKNLELWHELGCHTSFLTTCGRPPNSSLAVLSGFP